MQGAGLCNNITDADDYSLSMECCYFNRPVRIGLIVHVSNNCLSGMETLQAKPLKA